MAKRKPPMKTIPLNHGGKKIQIPVLSAPVGRPSSALNLRYPTMNQQVDVDIVDYYLSQLEAFKMYRYFCGPFTDYLGARDMVNPRGDHKEVADAARLFEKVLFESRRTPTVLAVQ